MVVSFSGRWPSHATPRGKELSLAGVHCPQRSDLLRAAAQPLARGSNDLSQLSPQNVIP